MPADRAQLETALAELRSAAAGCTACKLAGERTQVVFGCGRPVSPMMLIGQSPGEQEDRAGEPFVGRAGQLLTECLAACGIRREQVWITNIVKCRPWVRTERGRGTNRDPEPDEIAACRGWIEGELALVRPRVIVCVGAPSATLILGRRVAITQDRGRWFDEHPFRPARVMPVLHPAYLVRKYGAELEELKRQLTADLDEARKEAARLRREPLGAPAPASREPEVVQASLFGADDS